MAFAQPYRQPAPARWWRCGQQARHVAGADSELL